MLGSTNRANKNYSYAQEVIENSPKCLKVRYQTLELIITKIKGYEARLGSLKAFNAPTEQINAITEALNKAKQEYTAVQKNIIDIKKKMNIKCGWEK